MTKATREEYTTREQQQEVRYAMTGLLRKLQNFAINAKAETPEMSMAAIHRRLYYGNILYRLAYEKALRFQLFLDCGVDSEEVDELFVR